MCDAVGDEYDARAVELPRLPAEPQRIRVTLQPKARQEPEGCREGAVQRTVPRGFTQGRARRGLEVLELGLDGLRARAPGASDLRGGRRGTGREEQVLGWTQVPGPPALEAAHEGLDRGFGAVQS